jgi:hypothetical protein
VEIAPGRGGPFEGGILWGQNANRAIQALRISGCRFWPFIKWGYCCKPLSGPTRFDFGRRSEADGPIAMPNKSGITFSIKLNHETGIA